MEYEDKELSPESQATGLADEDMTKVEPEEEAAVPTDMEDGTEPESVCGVESRETETWPAMPDTARCHTGHPFRGHRPHDRSHGGQDQGDGHGKGQFQPP